MKIVLTGATGLVGPRIVRALTARGDDVVVLSRNPDKAKQALGVDAVAWNPEREPAPAAALAGADAVVHLAGAPVAQRWTEEAKRHILVSREAGTRNLVAGLRATPEHERPETLVSTSAVGYYGKHGDEPVPEDTPPGVDFLADVCVRWEREAQEAAELGMRVAIVRTGIVLDAHGGALATMLTPFKLGVGGPVAGGRQYMPWIHLDDLVDLYLAALDDPGWSGPYNGAAPAPATNAAFSKALGAALHRPAVAPIPAFVLKLRFGGMAELVTDGQRAVPERALAAGFSFTHPDLDEALRSALD
jgi:uncharacterized protein (TIGR01777 family)